MKKLFVYGFVCANGTYKTNPPQSTGTLQDADQLYRRLIAARDYVAEHPDETPPPGTLREAVLHGAVVWCKNIETNNTGSIRIDPPKPKTTAPQTEKTTEQQTEQQTETPKTHKKTPDTTEKKLRRIFAELARLKEDIAELQMRR